MSIDALRDLHASNEYARYVAVFQNWMRPAGASFDHLHKQVVGIEELDELAAGEGEAAVARGGAAAVRLGLVAHG